MNAPNIQKEKIDINQREEEVEINLIELVYFFRNKMLILFIAVFLGAVGAGLITHYVITPQYEATSKLYMVSASGDSVVDLTDLNLGTSLSSDYRELLYIRPIFDEIIKDEKLEYTYEQLMDMVNIEAIEDTRILTITVTSPSQKEAQNVANALADKAVTYLPKLMETEKPNIAEYAIYPQEMASPSLVKNIVIGALALLVLVMAVLTVLFVLDDTIQSGEDVEKEFGVMPLAVIPEGNLNRETESRKKENLLQKKEKR